MSPPGWNPGLLQRLLFHVRLGPAGSHRRCAAFRGPAHRRTSTPAARHRPWLRLRAGDAAAARAPRVAAHRHRRGARPADLQAGRPALRPHAWACAPTPRRRSRASMRTCSIAQGVARLCYCGPVLHTRPDRPHATREPLQFGAEIYGHAGLEADLEIAAARARLPAAPPASAQLTRRPGRRAHRARAARRRAGRCRGAGARACRAGRQGRAASSQPLTRGLPGGRARRPAGAGHAVRRREVLAEARSVPAGARPPMRAGAGRPAAGSARPASHGAPRQLRPGRPARLRLLQRRALRASTRPAPSDALVRGGRYDEVGAVFGRNRPAVGFSLDVKELVGVAAERAAARRRSARPGASDAARCARPSPRCASSGETVVCVLPGHEQRSATNSTATASWSRDARPAGSCAPSDLLTFFPKRC